jgi:hexokinase
MANVPKDLLEQIADLERLFTVGTEKLITITDQFVKELYKGLSKEGGNIPMLPAWVMGFPDGTESGAYLALDMGGTNLRVCEVVLMKEGRKFDMIQSKYRMVWPFHLTDKPSYLKTGTGDEMFGYIADCLAKFLKDNEDLRSKNKEYHLGFTFSYPCEQSAINHGVLQRWTKGFDVTGVEGQDVVPLFEAALRKRGVPIKVTAVVNDTTGTLIASNYADPNTKIGCIFGTGSLY